MSSSEILIVAGEVSGDLHAAPVVDELKQLDPALRFFGSGGSLMKTVGVELLANLDEMAVMGFSDVPRVLPRLSKLKRQFLKRVRESDIKLAILVDYPGFNLNLATSLKRLPNPPKVLIYIAPQVWAWRAGRVKLMSRVIDKLAVVFPFELDIFKSGGVPVEFVGHPLIDELRDEGYLCDERTDTERQERLIALLPGSRLQEVHGNLPLMIAAAERIRHGDDSLSFGIGCSSNIDRSEYDRVIKGRTWLKTWNNARELLSKSVVAAVCSGTATLEATLLGTPQVVVYKTSPLNYLLARRFVKLPRIALVNVVGGEEVVAELVQHEFTVSNLVGELDKLLSKSETDLKMSQNYDRIRKLLGDGGSANKVANMALALLK